MITYKWKQKTGNEDLKERTILATEDVTETKEEVFTFAQKENELEGAKQSLIDTQIKINDLKAEITKIKIALKI